MQQGASLEIIFYIQLTYFKYHCNDESDIHFGAVVKLLGRQARNPLHFRASRCNGCHIGTAHATLFFRGSDVAAPRRYRRVCRTNRYPRLRWRILHRVWPIVEIWFPNGLGSVGPLKIFNLFVHSEKCIYTRCASSTKLITTYM